MKSISIDQISAKSGHILSLKQKNEVSVTEVLPAELAHSSSLVFASNKTLFTRAIENKAPALIINADFFNEIQNEIPVNLTLWTTKSIPQAMSSVLGLFDQKSGFLLPGIHPSANVHSTAHVAATARIGAFSVIEAYAKVGENTVIFPHVYIGAFCEIGQRCNISSHVTIGTDGFGYFTDKDFTHHKIPQIGRVVIEDDCDIGSHCAIDRATLTETRIKKGSKFDNFCHIAHNVQVGENALVAAGFIVAGSTIIGKNLMTSGGVHVLGHLTIADNVILSARAGATQNIELPGMYGGFPLEEHRESIKTHVSLPHLKKLRKQVARILKHLNLSEEN